MPDGKTVNLTAALGVKFFNEDTDTPSTPAVLRFGRLDEGRQVRAALRPLRHLASLARWLRRQEHHRRLRRGHEIRLRYVRTETDPRKRWIDPAKPLLLSAENLKTMDSGFFRGSVEGGEPKQLVMAAKVVQRAGEGQGRRRLPAHRRSPSTSSPTCSPPTALSGTAQGERRQSAEGPAAVGHGRTGELQERRWRAARRPRSTSRRTSIRTRSTR